jgi:hypothetical protein
VAAEHGKAGVRASIGSLGSLSGGFSPSIRGDPQQTSLLLHAENSAVRIQMNDAQRSNVQVGQCHFTVIPTPALARGALARASVGIGVPLCFAAFAHPKWSHSRN